MDEPMEGKLYDKNVALTSWSALELRLRFGKMIAKSLAVFSVEIGLGDRPIVAGAAVLVKRISLILQTRGYL
jgi:hypothetical protein